MPLRACIERKSCQGTEQCRGFRPLRIGKAEHRLWGEGCRHNTVFQGVLLDIPVGGHGGESYCLALLRAVFHGDTRLQPAYLARQSETRKDVVRLLSCGIAVCRVQLYQPHGGAVGPAFARDGYAKASWQSSQWHCQKIDV